MSEDKSYVVGKCCYCGCELTQEDYERGMLIFHEIENPYTNEIDEIQTWCSNCYAEEFESAEEDEDYLDEYEEEEEK